MFFHHVDRRFWIVGLMLGGLLLWPGLAPASPVLQWDRGLALLDEDQPDAAAAHIYLLLDQHPHRLELLEACCRVEQRRSHADSVLVRVGRKISGETTDLNTTRLFLAAELLRRQGQFAAAADSFGQLALVYDDRGDPLSALVAARKAARCRLDGHDTEAARRAALDLEARIPTAPDQARLRAETEFLIAGLHFKFDELDQAEPLFAAILVLAETHGYPGLQSDAANALGSIMAKRRRQDESLRYYEQSVEMARRLGDHGRLSLSLANLGYMETHLRHFESARQYLLEGDQLARRWGHRRPLGTIQAGLGAIAEKSGDRVEAVERFTEAVTLSQQGGNTMSELGARQRLGYNLSMMGHYAEAQEQFEICLDMLDSSGSQFILNWVLGDLALTNQKLGYLDQAAEYLQRAHAVNLAMDDRMSAAWCLNSLGRIQSLRGDYRQALITHHRALDQYKALNDREGAGEVEASMADVFLQLGNYQQALQHCRRAIAIAEEVGAQELLRGASHTMATAYSATGQEKLAEQNYLRVIEIARQWSDQVVEIWALNDLAGHYLDTGRKEEARSYLQTALEMLRGEDYYHVRSLTFLHLARAAENPAKAAAWAGQALELATAGGLPDREWNAMSDLGWYHHQMGRTQQAEELQLRSIELVESLRRRAGADELRRHMLRPALKPYERLIEIYVEEGPDAAAAFTISERSRAQILAGRLQAAQGHTGGAEARATDPEERDLAATITFLQSQLQDAELPASRRDSLRMRIGLLETEFSLLKLRWSAEEELEAQVLYPDPPNLESMLQVLTGNEHLLSYFLGENRAYLFSVNRKGVKVYPLGDTGRIVEKTQLFLRLQRHGGMDLPENIMLEARQELYELLIAPAWQDIKPGTTLIFVPDGLLHRVPFAFLHDGDGYLIEKGALFTAPSLQVLGYLRQRVGGDRVPEPGGVLAIGCAESEGRVHPYNDSAVTRLPYADEEAWRLAEIFDGAVILTGHAANEKEIRSGVLAGADIVHFAAHSYADENDFRHSYMVLNRAPGTEAEGATSQNDGLLQWYEIVNLELNASLVTLASCRSAGGALTSGEGITGLTQAFLHAGSRGVLATLTDVPDQNTSWAMDRFYRELSGGATAASALRLAQLAGLKQGALLGAEFVLIGDGALTHRDPKKREWGTLALAAVGLCLALGIVMMFYLPKKKSE